MERSGLDLFFALHRSLHAPPPGTAGGTIMQTVCADLTEAQYRQRPEGHKSIAFALWHITRPEDMLVDAVLHGEPEVLNCEGWLVRLHVDKRDVGAGWTSAEVDVNVRRGSERPIAPVASLRVPQRTDQATGLTHFSHTAVAFVLAGGTSHRN